MAFFGSIITGFGFSISSNRPGVVYVNAFISIYYFFREFIIQVALFLAPTLVSMPLAFKAAMILSTVRLDSPVLVVIKAMDILVSDAIRRITAISFNERRSLNDNGVFKTSFWRLAPSETSSCCNGSFQRICSVRWRRSAGIPKTAKFINRSNGSNVRWIPLGIFSY